MAAASRARALLHPWDWFRRRLLAEEATRAQEVGEWALAAGLWGRVRELSEDPVPAWLLLRLGIAHREAMQYAEATTILEKARRLYPANIHFATNLAQVATSSGQWPRAFRAWQDVIREFGDDAPVRAWARAADAGRRMGALAEAATILADGQQRHGDAEALLRGLASLEEKAGDLEASLSLWKELLTRPAGERPVMAFRGACLAHWRRGEPDQAREIAGAGLEEHPGDRVLLRMAAELAMVCEDWVEAVPLWASWLAAREPSRPARVPDGRTARGWHEGTWRRLARAAITSPRVQELFSVDLAVAIAATVGDESPQLARDLLVAAGPDHVVTDHWRDLFELELVRESPVGPVPEGLGPTRDTGFLDDLRSALEVLPTGESSLVLPCLSVAEGSPEALAVRSWRWLNRAHVRQWTARTSAEERWPELDGGSSVVDAEALEWSHAFARRYAESLSVPPDVLAEAVFLPLQQTLLALRPLRRLADHIAAEPRRHPVLVELPAYLLRIFDPVDVASAWPLLLLTELRRRGVSAAFVATRRVGDEQVDTTPLRVEVGPTLLVGRGIDGPLDTRQHDAAIFPAGIRAVERVAQRVDDPLVYSSDAIVGSFAYDRTHQRPVDYRPAATVLPPVETFEGLTWHLGTTWSRRRDGNLCAELASTGVVDADVLTLAHSILGGFLANMMTRARGEVSRRGLTEVHIADHLYAGSAIVSGAVRESGGRTVLWPHSANPVHTDVRPRKSFERVYAITARGCRMWHDAHPEAEVRQAADLMLPWAAEPALVAPEEPLHVVVIGGKATLGLTHFLPDAEHRELVFRTFEELGRLSADGALKVLFKPKGGGGEGMGWIDAIVGDSVDYDVVEAHPLRIDRPNLLYVSVSMGSSALLEGVTRGIPGLVVRDFPVADYTTIGDGSIPILRLEEAIEEVRACVEPAHRRKLAEAQVAELAQELGRRPSWSTGVTKSSVRSY